MIAPLRPRLAWVIFTVAMSVTARLIAADGSSEVAVTTPDGTVHLPTYKVKDVYLPPLFTHTRKFMPWRYVRVAGFEILSGCDDFLINDFASRVSWEQGLVNMTVPANLQARSVVPSTILLLGQQMKDAMSKSVANLAKRNSLRESKALTDAAGVSSLSVSDSMLQIRLWDADSTGVDVVLDENSASRPESNGSVNNTGEMGNIGSGTVRSSPGGNLNHVVFKPEYLFSVLSRRAPSPPAWFIYGMLNFRYRGAGDNFYVTTRSISNGDEVMSRPAFWLSKDITALLREFPGSPRELLPMKELLTEPPPPAAPAKSHPSIKPEDAAVILLHGAEPGSSWRYEVWKAQAALFVRWAFDDNSNARRQALWKFVDRASRGPATEEMFRDCFGIGFNEMGRRLNAYLGKAVNEELDLFPASAIEVPVPEIRDPTEAEEARILGDWERKEIEFVKASHQEYADAYVQQADDTLLGAYRRGSRDPGLLAAIGLYACSLGNDGPARNFLEEAVRAGVMRPRAYVDLARIRLNAALAAPAGAGGKLDAGQVASVLDLLRAIRPEEPPQFAAYLLTALVWTHAAIAPTPSDLSMLEEGLSYFPDNSRLILATAQVEAQTGRRNELIGLIDRGVQTASDPAARKLFAALRAQIEPTKSQPEADLAQSAASEARVNPSQPSPRIPPGPGSASVRIGVIVDMTPEGKRVERPTLDKPAYYFPIYVGYKEMGDVLTHWHRPPPVLEETKRQITAALYEQGYRVATKLHPPSLAIVFRWGTIAAEGLPQPKVNGIMWQGESNPRVPGQAGYESLSTVPNINGGAVAANQNEVMTIIAGDRWGDLDPYDPQQQEFIDLAPRYYLLISALDFPAFTHHKQVLLWRAHVSTNYWGRYLDEVLEPLIAAAAPMLGKETKRPQIVSAVPAGHVIIGTPVVRDYPGTVR